MTICLNSQMLKTKQELELFITERAKGAQVRYRIKWIEEGERNTAFFLNLEKRNVKYKIMSRIVNEVLTNQKDILTE